MNFIDKNIEDYAINHSSLPGQVADELEVYTKKNVEMPQMLVGKLEASFLGFLIKSIGVKKVLEFGTFTGYSSLCMAQSMDADGVIHTLDINSQTVNIAKEYWEKAGVSNKIIPHIGPAIETINSFNETDFDLVFIDADKENYLNYFKHSLSLLSKKGVIVIDNVLWSGKVLTAAVDESTAAIQKINEYIKDLDNVHATLLPVRDGMFLIKKTGA